MAEQEKQGVCAQVRTMFDEAVDEQSGFVAEHLKECSDCKRWAQRTVEIASLASNLPSFDVPESVTQGILASIAQAQHANSSRKQWLVPVLSIVALICLWTSVSVETPEGLCSWVICGLMLLAFKILADTITNAKDVNIGAHK